ncbi:bifunctional lysylphosphatidylglycerol flippase/synthetase MprF [Kineococcus sp. GCM10028916]|uniref:bifunctional lysylphosphatidylglycerol flippase/synthetase MprF n=1 Tax=Kineococcus sp. GCM10028916 TaxID=3273394 RepID=UPI0036318084
MSSPPLLRPRTLAARRLLAPLLVLGLLAAAAMLLRRALRHYDVAQLDEDLVALGAGAVLAALAATAVSYLAMTGYDALALRYVKHPLPYRCYGLASFVATAFGNNLGASAVVGAALRARVYSSWQVPRAAITAIIGFNLVTLTLGVTVLAGSGMLLDPARVGQALHLPDAVITGLGSLLLVSVLAYLLWSRFGRSIGWRGWRVDRPAPRLAVAQVLLSTLEWLAMAAALYVLLPGEGRLPFLAFAVAFAIATVAGLVSNVPGGLGVFESTLVLLIASSTSPGALAVALVAYRLCYFVLPLLLAAVLLVVHEARRSAVATASASASAMPAGPRSLARLPSVPTSSVLALVMAGAGVFMLLVGDLPGPGELDVSAMTISLAGLGALFTAQGLHHRLKRAWVAALALLTGVTGVATAHADLVLAAVTAGLALLLVLAGSTFYRGVLLARPRNPSWSITAAVLIGVAVWWYEFSGLCGVVNAPLWAASVSGGASGADRVAMVVGAVGVLIGGRRIARAVIPDPQVRCEVEMAKVAGIVAQSGRCTSHLAFTGDKRFHFNPSATSFLMYQVEGRSWVVMGDPVGDPDDVGDLVASFVAEVDSHGGRPVFYNVSSEHTDLYRDCGLSLAKLGEEAVIVLDEFTLAGKARMGLRNCRNKSQRLGLSVDFVAVQDVTPLLPALREVSDAWLTHRNGKEKRFSLGAFDEDYVARFPLVVVRQEEQIIAFATLWIDGDGQQVQVDLMRRLPDGPRTVMTYLFIECILWAKEQGFSSFSLGVAPLSGLRSDVAPSAWDRVGHLLWTHGERFYNFKGLRAFKQGFQPRWRTCYVATPGGLVLPKVMVDVATLVGGGIRGIVRS